MDHCPLPRNPVHGKLQIPYLCSDLQYTPPFGSYFSEKGWTVAELFEFDFRESDRTHDAIDPLLQSWLFFGLIEESLGLLLARYKAPGHLLQLLKRDPSGQLLVNTEALHLHYAELKSALQELSIEESLVIRHVVAENIFIAYYVLQKQLDQMRRLEFGDPKVSDPRARQSLVSLSVMSLCTYLANLFEVHDNTHQNRPVYLEQGFLEFIMLEDGWCPSQVKRLSRVLTTPILYLVTRLRRPDTNIDHSGANMMSRSLKCSEWKCFADQVRLDAYITKHDDAHHNTLASCISKPFLRVDQKKSYDLLKRRVLPLAIFNSDTCELRTVGSDEYPRYVAISHVWAHGLGNPYDNSLPECQLRRLSKIVNELYPEKDRPIPFWVDTLSCPTEPDEATSLAIIEMRNTYRNADKVLVLDSYLEQDVEGMSTVECLLRIICSAWTTRLWTLQEGALAEDLWFQFRDRAINLTRTQHALRNDPETVYRDVDDSLVDLGLQWDKIKPENTAQQLFILSKAVRYRSTSVPEDEVLCLGTLAGLDMEVIADVRVPPKERMLQFWTMFEKPPSMLVFWEGKKLQVPGYRWAPATLLGQSWITVPGSNRKGFWERLDKEQTYQKVGGRMVISSPGILLGPWTARIVDDFWARIENDIWLHVTCSGEKGFLRKDEGDTVFQPENDSDDADTASLAIIFQNPMEPAVLDAFDEGTSTEGLLVSVTRNADLALQARPITQVFVVSASSCWPSQEPLIAVQRIAEQIDNFPESPDVKAGPENVHIEYSQTASEWEGADRNMTTERITTGRTGGRWSYRVDNQYYVFDALTLDDDQSWCVG